MINTRAQRKLPHTWIIQVIVKQHLAKKIKLMDLPSIDQKYSPRLNRAQRLWEGNSVGTPMWWGTLMFGHVTALEGLHLTGKPQKALRGGIPCPFLEPSARFCQLLARGAHVCQNNLAKLTFEYPHEGPCVVQGQTHAANMLQACGLGCSHRSR